MEAEIYLRKLPYRIKYEGNFYGLGIYKNKDSWTVNYFPIFNSNERPSIFNGTQETLLQALQITHTLLQTEKII